MAVLSTTPIKTQAQRDQFEAEMSLDERLPEQSVLDVFEHQAKARPEQTALTMVMTGAPDEDPRRVNYRDLLGLIRRAANMFTTLGGPTPGVAYMLPSLVETHVTLWGAESAGYAVPINFLLQPDDIAALLRASDAKILVALGPHPQLDIWEKALKLKAEMPNLTLVQVSPPGVPTAEEAVSFGASLMAESDDYLKFGAARSGDDVAAYFHTGGTTGTPKLIAHTHRGQLVAAFGGAVMMNLRSDDTLTATFPLFHVAGTIACALAPFLAGTHLCIMSPGGLRSPAMVEGFWRIAAQYKATLLGGVPTALGAVLDVPKGDADLSAVRAGITGAALLPPIISARFKEVTGTNLFEVYGMTEASGLIAMDPIAGNGTDGSVGIGLPYTNVDVRQLNADGTLGDVCGMDEIGVIAVQGDHISPSVRSPGGTEPLNSGDLGYKDADGNLFIAGRSKDIIIRSGHNIDPVMIENAMAEHPAVAVAAAVGMPDAYAGELPVCFVELRAGMTADQDALHAHAKETIGERPAWPKHIHVIDTVPVTTVGKIFKPALRCEAAISRVRALLADDFKCPDASVTATSGGPRGMKVAVTVPSGHENLIPKIEAALAAFLFEAEVHAA